MSDIKIPTGPSGQNLIDTVKDASDAASGISETQGTEEIGGGSLEPLDRIAQAVASGEIGQQEAVNQILTEVMDVPMVKAIPEALRAELTEMLTHLIETDPYLRSLQAAIAPNEIE